MKINSVNTSPIINSNNTYKKSNTSKDFKQISNNINKDNDNKNITENQNKNISNLKYKGQWALVHTGIGKGKIVSINYAKESTSNDPIMVSSDGDKFHINDIDPTNASELEMQMYCSHLDYIGKGTGSKFGTYNDLTTVRMTAHINSLSKSLDIKRSNHVYKDVKSNWVDLTEKVMSIVRGHDDKQFNKLDNMLNNLKK